MSPDLQTALKDAAPQPSTPLDVPDVARRAGRARRVRWAMFSALPLMALVLGFSINALVSDGGTRAVGADQGPPPLGVQIPDGPRYEVMSGRYGDDWWSHPGEPWKLLVWSDDDTACWQLATPETGSEESLACGTKNVDESRDYIAGSMSFFTKSSDPDQFWFVAGVVRPSVQSLEFRPDGGNIIEIPLHAAPPEARVSDRYYAATLPRFDYAEVTARDGDGRILQTNDICGPGCQSDREREDHQKVSEYESQPITDESHAAVAAVAALGHADLLDAFGTSYTYEGIVREGNDFRATFKVFDCSDALHPDGSYQCNSDTTPGWVRISIRDGRFVVSDASGPMTEDQRASLLAYAEDVPNAEARPEWRPISESHNRIGSGNWSFSAVLAWSGNLPPPVNDYGSMCYTHVRDGEGKDIYEGAELPMEVRAGEYYRVSAPLSGLSKDTQPPFRIEVTCDPPSLHFTARP